MLKGPVLYAAGTQDVFAGGENPAFCADMPPYKRQAVANFRADADKALSVTAHRLLCYAIKQVWGITPQSADWDKLPNGKPFLKGQPDKHFNLSHSGAVAVCVLDDFPVGVDVQIQQQGKARVAKRIMSAAEWAQMEKSEDPEQFFFQVWALKESYLKYTGEGISVPLGEISVYPVRNKILHNRNEYCVFTLLNDITGYQTAVCARGPLAAPLCWVAGKDLWPE